MPGPLFYLGLFLISLLFLILVSPKIDVEDRRASTLDDINFPQARDGMPAQIILGKARLYGPNTLWYGDFLAVPIITKQKTGIFSSKESITGYDYYVGFDLGLCLGEDVHLRRIWIAKEEAWSGDVGPSATSFTIDQPSLFGGLTRGGGFLGTARFYGGDFAQVQNAYVGGFQTDNPAYTGLAHLVFERPWIGHTAQLRTMSFELERFTNHLGLLAAERIITTTSPNATDDGEDLNPFEAIYELLTNEWTGAATPAGDIDIASFKAAGEVCAAEGNGVSLVLTKASKTRKVIEEVLRQVDGMIYQHPTTGKITARLIRDDYVVGDLPIYDEDDIVKVIKFAQTSWSETNNQLRVAFPDRHHEEKPYKEVNGFVQDMANISTQGKVRPANVSYPLCMERSVAVALGTRDLAGLSVPLYQVELEMNRKAATLLPGDVFRWSWDEYGIDEVIMRVRKYDQGSLVNGKVVMSATQDIYAVVQTIFSPPEDTLHIPPSAPAVEIDDAAMMEGQHWLMYKQSLFIFPVTDSVGFVFAFARAANADQLSYRVHLTQDAWVTTIEGLAETPFTDTVLVDTAITATQGLVAGNTTIVVKSPSPDPFPFFGAFASQIRESGYNLVVVNDELMAFEGVTDNLDGTWDLTNCHRALLDTEYAAHSVNDVVYFINGVNALVESEWDATTSVTARFMGSSGKNSFDFDDASNVVRTMNRRYEKSLPPDYISVAGVRSLSQSIAGSAALAVSWRERSRDDDLIRFEDDATQTPESGQEYDVELFIGATLRDTVSGVTGTSTTVDTGIWTGAAYILITTNINGGVQGGFTQSRYDFTVT